MSEVVSVTLVGLRRLRDGWVPVHLPQNAENEWCEWWWRKDVDYVLMGSVDAVVFARLRQEVSA